MKIKVNSIDEAEKFIENSDSARELELFVMNSGVYIEWLANAISKKVRRGVVPTVEQPVYSGASWLVWLLRQALRGNILDGSECLFPAVQSVYIRSCGSQGALNSRRQTTGGEHIETFR